MPNASFYITTLGCPKNQADSREMERSLVRRGFVRARSSEECDYHLINSCSFIESAREETIRTVLDAADLKRERADQKLILAGCFSERYATAVRDELPEVDLSFGTGMYHRAGEILSDRFGAPAELRGDSAPGAGELIAAAHEEGGRSGTYAAVKISDGCDRGCAFCAIPNFRGAFQDNPRESILDECRQLVQHEGVRELCLVSQDTNRYGGKVDVLLDLLEDLHGADYASLAWIRLLYLYPDPRTAQILRGIHERGLGLAAGGRIVPYLESPVQHVSSKVLRAMRRYGDADRFADLFGLARELFPDLEIRTSFLLGFPGEVQEDVDALIDFIHRVRPEKLALFAYSQEEGTPGFDLGDPVSAADKADRVNAVRQEHLDVLKDLHVSRRGQRYRCLVDGADGVNWILRRPQDAPEVDEVVFVERADAGISEVRPGELLDVEITGFYEYDMTGRIAGERVHV